MKPRLSQSGTNYIVISSHRLIQIWRQSPLLKVFTHQGYEIRIVTTRWRPEEIEEFIDSHQLPVAEIHCTKGELKAETIEQLGSQLHFDDNEAEAIALP